jgi:hypothetical protein
LPFDVAALDVVDTAGPFEETPAQIRSADGKVYMHWAFHRDWRQCGTFGAEPFILTTPGGNHDKGMDDRNMLRRTARLHEKKSRRAPATKAGDAAAASARANLNLASPDDPAAQHIANLWLSAFVAGSPSKMAKVSAGPFRSGGRVVATNGSEIAGLYKTIIAEAGSRRIKDWSILSAAGYRRNFGALPSGLEVLGSELLFVVRLKSETLTLVLEPSGKGDYRITGLYR